MKRTPMKRRYVDTGPDFGTVLRVRERDGQCCIRCGKLLLGERGRDWSIQHRVPRSGGGSNDPENLLSVCGSGTTGCHSHMESYRAEALQNGWLVSRYSNPACVAVLVDQQRRWVYLTPDFGYSDDPPEVVV